MDTNKLRKGWLETRNFSRAFRIGWLDAVVVFAENMPDGAFVGFMQEVLGDDWVQVLEEHGIALEERKSED